MGKSRGGLNTKIHMMVAGNQRAIGFILSEGEASDAGKGRLLLDTIGRIKDPNEDRPLYLLMDRAYEDWETRLLAFEWGYSPVVPPKKNRKHPWEYDKELYKQRNEVERMFRRLKGFRRIATRYDKLDLMFSTFICLALCVIAVCPLVPRSVNRP
jgi:transposase